MNPTSAFVPVHVSNPPAWTRRRDTGLEKARAAAAKTHRLTTKAKQQTLLRTLRSPPMGYDGTNGKLAEYLGCSVRTVIRLLKGLEDAKAIRIERFTLRSPAGFFVQRTIQVLQELN